MDGSNDKPKKKVVQTAPQPVPPMPEQPLQPAPAQPVNPGQQPYQMPPKKGLSKGALWGIIGGSIGLVLVIVGVVLAIVLLGGPSKEDYAKAADYMQDFKIEDNKDIFNAKTSDEAKKKIDEFTKKADEYFDKLGADKVMRDAEVKKAYDAYKDEWGKTKTLLGSLGESMVASNDVRDKCKLPYISYMDVKSSDEYGKKFDDETAACTKVLDQLKKSEAKPVKEYAESYSKYLQDLRAYGVAMAERYVKKDYSSARPSYPSYPSASSPATSLYKDLGKIEISDREKDLYNLLREKADK